jgi:hypothetical protein
MTDDVSLYAWVRVAANTVGLTDWDFELVDEHLPNDVMARINIPTGRRHARIMLGEQYHLSTPHEQRATIVHELLHCHFDAVGDLATRTLPDILGLAAWSVYEEANELLTEQAVDAIAVAFAEFLPLPPEGSS